MAENQGRDIDSYCLESTIPDSLPSIRFIGGITLEPQIDPTSGTPSSCGLTIDLLGNIQAALAPFQPFLSVMDLVATLAQCTLLLGEVVTNPFKIPKFLACIPGLIGKINTVLSIIPVFPQGIQKFVTFVVDIIRFINAQIDCIIEILESVQVLFEQIGQISDAINNTDDTTIVGNLQTLLECSQEEADKQVSLSLSALGPVARILCTIRSILALIPAPSTPFPPGASITVNTPIGEIKVPLPPSGNDVQKILQFPDPSNIGLIEDAISALRLVHDALEFSLDVITILSFGLIEAPPPVGFQCPLDDLGDDDEEVVEEILQPSITALVPATLPAGSPDTIVQVTGENFTASTEFFFGTSPQDAIFNHPASLTVTLSSQILSNSGTFQVYASNQSQSAGRPFSDILAPGEEHDSSGISEAFPFEVT